MHIRADWTRAGGLKFKNATLIVLKVRFKVGGGVEEPESVVNGELKLAALLQPSLSHSPHVV